MEASQPVLIHLKSPECKRCGIYIHRTQHTLSPNDELAWIAFNMLDSPVVQRFNLTSEIFNVLGSDLTRASEGDDLIGDVTERDLRLQQRTTVRLKSF